MIDLAAKPAVLSLFDYTGRMVAPWVEAGYDAWIIDTQHPDGTHRGEDGITRVGADLMNWWPPLGLANRLRAVFAFPPCTDLANSGNRHKQRKGLGSLVNSLALIERSATLCEWLGQPYLIENPVGSISTYWRKPDYTFNPCSYGGYLDPPADHYNKRTCLWTGHGFIMPEKKSVEPSAVCPQGSWVQQLGGKSITTKNARSATPMGFARAIYDANAGALTPA